MKSWTEMTAEEQRAAARKGNAVPMFPLTSETEVDVGTMKTSDLIAAMITDSLLRAHGLKPGCTEQEAETARLAIAAEIDRRIPVPDPRVGQLFRLLGWDRKIARCVAVEPGGALRLRDDGWSPNMSDYRSHPDEVELVAGQSNAGGAA